MRKALSVLTVTLFACALSLSAFAQQQAPAPKLKRVQMGDHGKHPEMDAAIMHLREAKKSLEEAKHDFAGHRAKALHHVEEALEECRVALETAK
jgi:hypothetical protein